MTEPIPQIMVCPLSLEQAKQKSELEVWLYSRMANLQCKEALEQVQQPDLHTEQGQALLRDFGIDRLMWVTACSMAQVQENEFTRSRKHRNGRCPMQRGLPVLRSSFQRNVPVT